MSLGNATEIELSIVMPCLNEAETLATCIRKAQQALRELDINGEIIIADNGSSDGSQDIAQAEGARVIPVPSKGYGNALRGGIAAARGRYVLMGDADDSYDFLAIGPFVEKLRAGADVVMGCRLPAGGGTILPGAMPWKHRWLGNPVLTMIGRVLFGCPANDFHCGMRAFTKAAFTRMELGTTGMEFASELIIKATLTKLRIEEVPITLHRDGRSRPPHLRSWRDGWRHLRFMLLFSPRWLFFVPGMLLSCLGAVGLLMLIPGQLRLGAAILDAGTMMAAAMALLVGTQLVWFAIFTRAFAENEGLLPPHERLKWLMQTFTLEWGVAIGALMSLTGCGLFVWAFLQWQQAGYHGIGYSDNLRRIIPACTLIVWGIQWVFSSFFLGVLSLQTLRHQSQATR